MADVNQLILQKKKSMIRTELDYGKSALLSVLASLENQEVVDATDLAPKLKDALSELISSLSALENKMYS
jgi:hypothetical protein